MMKIISWELTNLVEITNTLQEGFNAEDTWSRKSIFPNLTTIKTCDWIDKRDLSPNTYM